jgi:hypothetical protein
MGEGALRRSAISPRAPLFLSPAHVQQICTTVPVVRFFLVLHMYNRSVLLYCRYKKNDDDHHHEPRNSI